MNNHQINSLYIVAGAAGEIGTSFCKDLSNKKIDSIAVLRNNPLTIDSEYITAIKCDLTDSRSISESFKSVDLAKYDRIVFIHTIGTDKFDPRGYPNIRKMKTIDPDIYDTNVNTFKYPLRYLLDQIREIHSESGKQIKLKLVLLGGIPDKFSPFVIEGFCEAKNICRQYIRSVVGLHADWVTGLSINVSSTVTKSALKVRPFADLSYWLTPEEVVFRSIEKIVGEDSGYSEIEIHKDSPEFKDGYYEDKDALYTKWSRETGVK